MKSYTNTTKNCIISNCTNNKEVKENISFTQIKHNSDEGMLNNYSDSNELTVKNSSMLNLSKKKTNNIKKKNTDDCKNKFKKSSNIKLSISDSESSSSEDIEFPIKVLGYEHYFSKENENDTSNSDDEMHSKFRQNTNNFKIYYNSDESNLSFKLSSNVINVNPINISKTNNCNKSLGNNLLSDKKTFKKYIKRKEVNNKSTFSQLSNKIINQTDIDQILKKDSSGDDGLALINKLSNEKQANEKVLNKNLGSTIITNSSSDDELFILNLLKSKKKIHSSNQNNINLLVNEEDKKNKLINEILTLIKHKNKIQKQKLKLHIPQATSYVSENRNKLFKSDKITKVEPIVKTKNRKDVLHLKVPVKDSKCSMPIYNASQQLNSSKLNTKPSNGSIHDEKYIIKKIMKKRKLSKIKKVDVQKQTIKDIPTEKLSKPKEKLYKKESMLDGLKNDVINKKREIPKRTKDFLIDRIIGALEDSSSNHGSTKKKKPII